MTLYLIFTTYTRNGFKKLQCEQTLYTMRNWFSFDKRQVFKCWKYSERNNRIDNISSHRRCSVTKGVLRNFSKFVGKHLCQSLFFKKVAALRPATLLKRGTGTDQFLWILRISKNTFFHRTSLGGYFCLHLVLFWRKPLLRTMIFSVCFFSNLSVLFPILFVRLCWLYPLRFCELNIL